MFLGLNDTDIEGVFSRLSLDPSSEGTCVRNMYMHSVLYTLQYHTDYILNMHISIYICVAK